jgi:hypothetical protein
MIQRFIDLICRILGHRSYRRRAGRDEVLIAHGLCRTRLLDRN